MKYSIFHLDWSKRKVYKFVHVIEGFTCPDWLKYISGQHNNLGMTNWLKIISRVGGFFCLVSCMGQRKNSESQWVTYNFWDSEVFLCLMLMTRQKNIFPYFFTELKTCHLFYFINKLEHRAQLFQGWLTLTQPALG